MPKLLRDELEMIHSHNSPLWQGSIPQKLMATGGMSLEDLDAEIARGAELERLRERLPEVMTPVQQEYLAALRRDRIQLVARRKL
ncbi:MAG TPA: hypothetical protein VGN17_25010 [Bryobacteraceae bacterium]|jgi:hypothetical protein